MKYIKRLTTPRAYSRYISDDWKNTIVPHPTEEELLQNAGPTGQEIAQVLENQDIAFSIEMNTAGNFFTFKMTNTTEDKIVYNFKVDISTFFNSYAQTLWIVNDQVMIDNMWKDEEVPLTVENFYDSFSNTYNSKSNTSWSDKTLFAIYARAEGASVSMDDFKILLIHPRSVNYTPPAGREIDLKWVFEDENVTKDHAVAITGNVTLDKEWPPCSVYPPIFMPIIDEIQLTSTRIDGGFTVDISTYPNVSYVYLTSNAGILPKTKINIDQNGHGTFKVLTTGLDTGDEIIVKAGFRSVTNVSNITLTV